MQSKLALFTLSGMLLASFGGVAAAPAAEAANDLAARAGPGTGNIFACTDWDFKGSCTNVKFNNGACTNFPSGFQDDISSIGPDGGWTCQLYVNYFCNNDQGSYSTKYPGIAEISTDNDAFSSFLCNWTG